jgi:hypothetical protein
LLVSSVELVSSEARRAAAIEASTAAAVDYEDYVYCTVVITDNIKMSLLE